MRVYPTKDQIEESLNSKALRLKINKNTCNTSIQEANDNWLQGNYCVDVNDGIAWSMLGSRQ